jgi:hypothetical protein
LKKSKIMNNLFAQDEIVVVSWASSVLFAFINLPLYTVRETALHCCFSCISTPSMGVIYTVEVRNGGWRALLCLRLLL